MIVPAVNADSNTVLNSIRARIVRGVPAGWRLTTLGECFKWSSGGTPRRTDPSYFGGDIPWAVIGDLNDGVVTETQSSITQAGLRNSSAKWVEPGSVLVAMYGSIGKLAIAGRHLTTNQAIAFTKPDPVDPKYLYYYLFWQRPSLARLGRGATQLNISQTVLKEFPFLLAPPDEQHRIVAEIEKQFSRLDEAVANLKRVKANLKRYKGGVLDAAVKGRIGTKGAASDDELPTGWQWSSVGELATVGTGTTPARSNEAFYRGGTIPWITSSAVNEPFVDAAEQFVTDEALRQTNLTLYPPGTLLVAMYGEGKTRGKCSELRIAATTNQALAALQVDPAVRPWLKLFLDHNYDDTRRIASGGVQPNLNLGLIRAIRLPLPPADEQRRTVAEVDRRLSVVREVETEVEVNRERAKALRQAVLTRAFVAQP